MRVARPASSVIMIVPERWYDAPQMPKKKASPDRPAARCKLAIKVFNTKNELTYGV